MYLDYWKLAQPPFAARPDSRYLFATPQHEQALAAISYAACTAGEPALLTGPAGCGKTLLLRALRRQLPREHYHVAFVPEIGCASVSLLQRVAYHLTHNAVPDATAAMDVLARQVGELPPNGGLIIMLDDWPAQVRPKLIAELRWLLALDIERGHVCVLLAAEDVAPQRDWPPWLVQRLVATAAVGPLETGQVPEYLRQRLRIAAGPECDPSAADHIFTPAAAAVIADWSRGVPRLINRLARLALHVAALEQSPAVDVSAVERAAARLMNAPGDGAPDSDAPPLPVTAQHRAAGGP